MKKIVKDSLLEKISEERINNYSFVGYEVFNERGCIVKLAEEKYQPLKIGSYSFWGSSYSTQKKATQRLIEQEVPVYFFDTRAELLEWLAK